MASGPGVGDGAGSGKVYSRKTHPTSSKRPPSVAGGVARAEYDDGDLPSLLPHLRTVTISLSSPPPARLDLRRKLLSELEQVRALVKKLDSHIYSRPSDLQSQLSGTDPINPVSSAATSALHNRHLSASDSAANKEKRTSKSGKFQHGPDSFMPSASGGSKDKKQMKSNGNSAGGGGKKKNDVLELQNYEFAFKSCSAVLARLMKHKHAWVFNSPVDAKSLGLHDYHTIIKQPMDLGTVKTNLGRGAYKSPWVFADDVRLTFQNAMTYNPKGQDVHIMAEQLLQLFEERWAAVEAEMGPVRKVQQPPAPPVLPSPLVDVRAQERSESMAHQMPVELNKNIQMGPSVSTSSNPKPKPNIGRPQVLKKPKAKDPNKREMTFEEKQRLSHNLQNLPPEKLDHIVQIIKKRNSSLSQHDDEIEVDIDSFDVETLWELDRFVTNYKKSLSKNKRKAELLILAQQDLEQHQRQGAEPGMVPEVTVAEAPKETITDDKYVGSSSPVSEKGEPAGRTSSSSASTSDSGSSSSDTESDSSSADEANTAQSP